MTLDRRVLSAGHQYRRTARVKMALLKLTKGKHYRLKVERGRNVSDGWEVVGYPKVRAT